MSIDWVIRNIEGYETGPMQFESELRALNRWGDQITEGVIVAIGSYRGQTDCAIALHAHVPIYAIDPREGWQGELKQFGDVDRPIWMRNVLAMGLGAKIRPINLPSLDAAKVWNKPISLLFIDGNHPEIADDLDAWIPHVIEGGIIATHDSNSPMVIQAITQRIDLIEIERADLTVFYRKAPLYEEVSYEGINFFVRKGPYNHDDKYVLAEVRSYDIGTDPVRTCIDVGAMIGAFTAWIQHAWPGSHTVSIEPEYSNYGCLIKNTRGGPGKVTPFLGIATYSPEAQLLVVDPINSGCHKVIPNSQMQPGQSVISVRGTTTLEQIMEDQGWGTLDLLKLDCEGSEVDILTHCSDDFLRGVRRIVGEFHAGPDNFRTGIGQRLVALGFEVTAETNPAAHSTFLAINKNWTEPQPEPLVEPKRKAGRPKKS